MRLPLISVVFGEGILKEPSRVKGIDEVLLARHQILIELVIIRIRLAFFGDVTRNEVAADFLEA